MCVIYIYIYTNLEQNFGLGFSEHILALHESESNLLLGTDRRLHRFGPGPEHFESRLSGTAVSAPADI